MRASLPAFAFAMLLSTMAAAHAAPTCQNRDGDTVRCATPGAMPVGWTLSPRQAWDRQLSRPARSNNKQLLEVFFVIGLLFALIALLPEFDNSRAGSWGRQENDQEDDDEESH